ncbi:MAG TPA: flagellin lysine-N-methylase [Bacilli bacterium]
MTDQTRTVLVPSYLQQFECIGSSCEDTCCAGWQVNVDHTTYKKYNKLKDLKLKSLLDTHVKRNRSDPTEANYGKIMLKPDSSCPLLNEDKLCTVQLKMGETYLSDVCTTYPRFSNKVNHIVEKAATMSCPEAARLALLNPDGMEFDEVKESITVRNMVGRLIDTESQAAAHKAEKYFWELRIFTIQVLQNRSYSLSERLIILGMFYQKADDCISASNMEEIPRLIASYRSMIEGGSIQKSLENIPVSVAIQMQLVKELIDERLLQGAISHRYLDCLKEVLLGIKYTGEAAVEETSEHYREAYHAYYQPFMREHEYILENYLVNYVFKTLFPLGGKSVVDEYVMLVMHYAMIKLHLIGMAGFHKGDFGVDHVIKLIQSFAKTIEHNALYLRGAIELLKKNNYTSMAYMAILIKN